MGKKRKRGRPLAEKVARSKIVPIRFTPGELQKIKAAAKKAGMTVSDWLRKKGLET